MIIIILGHEGSSELKYNLHNRRERITMTQYGTQCRVACKSTSDCLCAFYSSAFSMDRCSLHVLYTVDRLFSNLCLPKARQI